MGEYGVSEGGVPIMTLERIEEIKKKLWTMFGSQGAPINVAELNWLLATLAEAQQTINRMERRNKQIEESHKAMTDELYNPEIGLHQQLKEAQQTIVTLTMQLNTANDCTAEINREYLLQCEANGGLRKALEGQKELNRRAIEIWDTQDLEDDPVDTIEGVIKALNIHRGDKVTLTTTGVIGVISDIQYVHNRYQLKDVSGWQYGIDNIAVVVEGDNES